MLIKQEGRHQSPFLFLSFCRSAAAPLWLTAVQKGGQGIARGRDATLHQDPPDRAPVITAVGDKVQQHLFAGHLSLVAIHKVEREQGFAIPLAQSGHVLQIPGIQLGDGAAQCRQGRCLRGIGGAKAVG